MEERIELRVLDRKSGAAIVSEAFAGAAGLGYYQRVQRLSAEYPKAQVFAAGFVGAEQVWTRIERE